MDPATRHFDLEGHRLVFDEYGSGPRVVVLLPGLLFSRKMHRPLAETLSERGHRVLCLDLLGHGDSDRPPEMQNYSMTGFGRQAIALLDHVGVEQAVIGGTSLGANATLEAAAAAPERARGLLIEMPVLDNALLGCALTFTPLLVGLTFGAPVARLLGRGARAVPRGAFLIGDYRDPIHPFSDSDMLVREMPNARLLQASSILELRLTPERLTNEIVVFIEQCFRARARRNGRRRAPSPERRATHARRAR